MSLPSWEIIDFKVGKTYRASIGGYYVYKIHIVQIIDEGYGVWIVYRYYGKRKQWWHYEIEWQESLSLFVHKAKEVDEYNKQKKNKKDGK